MHLSSDDKVYGHDIPTDFTCKLPQPLYLEGSWTVTLQDIQLSLEEGDRDSVYIFSDICKDAMVRDKLLPLLHHIPLEQESKQFSPRLIMVSNLPIIQSSFPLAIPVRKEYVDTIRLFIMDNTSLMTNSTASFENKASRCTLLFTPLQPCTDDKEHLRSSK